MKLTQLALILALVAGICGCDPLNNVSNPPGSQMVLTVTTPTNMFGHEDATWRLNIQGGIAPYSVTWNFGGGALPNTATDSGTSTEYMTTITMVNTTEAVASWSGSVMVTDSTSVSIPQSFTYSVGVSRNTPPVVDSATFAGSMLTVIAHDDDGDALTITVDPPTGAAVDALTKDYVAGGIVFNFTATDVSGGVTGDVIVTANDGFTNSAEVTSTLIIHWGVPADDTLYALSISDNRVVLLTGTLPHPFQFLNGVSLTVDGDLVYKTGTFNAGAPGGAANEIDGAWLMMDPEKFLMPPENFIIRTELPGDSGRGRIDFNLTPIEGSDVTGLSGFLCNFELTGTPGTYTLGFHVEDTIYRTFYGDGDDSEKNYYLWGTYMADAMGELTPGVSVDNTITIK